MTALLLLEMVLRSQRHEHGSIHPQAAFAVKLFRRSIRRASRPRLVAAPGELYVDSRPRPPVGRVEPRRSLEPLVRELVPEVLCDVPEIGRIQAEGFRRLDALERGGGSR